MKEIISLSCGSSYCSGDPGESILPDQSCVGEQNLQIGTERGTGND